MSRTWGAGSTSAWRKLRAQVLARDDYRCRLRVPGVCRGTATCAHHVVGARRTGILCSPDLLVAACAPCNLATGEPTGDPPPRTAAGVIVALPAPRPLPPRPTDDDLAGVRWRCWRCKRVLPATAFHGRIRAHGCQPCHNEVRAAQQRRHRRGQRTGLRAAVGTGTQW